MQDLRASAVQFQHRPGDKPANLAVVRHFTQRAAEQGVQLLAFPECCVSGYWHLRKLDRSALEALAEPIPDGPTTAEALQLARRCRLTLGIGFIERADDGRLFNSYLVAMPDGNVVWHRKLHAFVSEHLSCGDTFTVFNIPGGVRVAVLICYDNNLIENVRASALLGAEVLMAPHQTGGCRTRSPWAMGRIDVELWRRRSDNPAAIEAEFRGDKGRGWLMRWLPSRAHDNGLFLIFSNGVGQDDDEVRTGNAMILDPYGRILVESCRAGDDMVVADLDPALRETCTGSRWLLARRPELYGLLAQATGCEQDIRTVRFGDDSRASGENRPPGPATRGPPGGWTLQRLVSGGQTGVDRGALDAALAVGLEHGGWCPRGRLAEDGPIPARYRLTETESPEYPERTERNVVESDGTLILYRGRMFGGTELTYRLTRKHSRPCLCVDLESPLPPQTVPEWLAGNGIRVLNVAGPRESSAPGIQAEACRFIGAVVAPRAV